MQALRLAGEPAQALATAEQALVVYPDHTDIVREAALSARDTGELERAAALAERCLALGDAPARYAGAIGAGTFLALGLLASIRAGAAALRRGRRAARALAGRAPVVHAGPRRARGRRGAARRRPAAPGRDRRRARDAEALGAARAAGVDAETLALHDGLARRGRALPVDAAPAALAALDRLLELQEFDAFESLAGLWNTLPLPERDRRELLAGIYMARGFLDSAAEEWLADRRVRADRARARRPRPRRARPRPRRRRPRPARRGAPARSDDRGGEDAPRGARGGGVAPKSARETVSSEPELKNLARDADYGLVTTFSIHGRIVDDRSRFTQHTA